MKQTNIKALGETLSGHLEYLPASKISKTLACLGYFESLLYSSEVLKMFKIRKFFNMFKDLLL